MLTVMAMASASTTATLMMVALSMAEEASEPESTMGRTLQCLTGLVSLTFSLTILCLPACLRVSGDACALQTAGCTLALAGRSPTMEVNPLRLIYAGAATTTAVTTTDDLVIPMIQRRRRPSRPSRAIQRERRRVTILSSSGERGGALKGPLVGWGGRLNDVFHFIARLYYASPSSLSPPPPSSSKTTPSLSTSTPAGYSPPRAK